MGQNHRMQVTVDMMIYDSKGKERRDGVEGCTIISHIRTVTEIKQ